MEIKEVRVQVPLPITSSQVFVPVDVDHVDDLEGQHIIYRTPQNEVIMNESIIDESQEVALRRSAISDDYVVYLQESKFDLGIDNDPVSFSHAIKSDSSIKWLDTMEEELKSMDHNEVWDLVELPEGCKRVGCKWVFKTKRDSNGNIERQKDRLFAKGFTQKDGVYFKETFSPVSKKRLF